MSWQEYVDDRLVKKSGFDKAAILSLADGGSWASSAGFQISPAEFEIIKQGFSNPSILFEKGLHIGGTKFLVNNVEDNKFILAKYKAPTEDNPIKNPNPHGLGTIMCMKSKQTIVVGGVGQSVTLSIQRAQLDEFVNQLEGAGF